jgi:hypothetical protein
MSNEIKQTSVEQLFHKLWDEPKDKFTWNAILKEYLEMHKHEIMDARRNGSYKATEKYGETRTNIQYYNETYRGGEQ